MSNPVPHAPGEWAKKVIHGNYFPHIDGLRSLAVLPVLFYHLWMPLCPAGFMGVDVFFVISGYLICGGIIRDLEVGSFSMKSFYFRRIRRIFPAYFAVVVFVLIAGISLYHWARIIPLAQTALFSAFFSTNIYFWLDIGYFQPHAHGNPLLHLWSLGVEEQFYIIIPIALLTLWKIRRTSLVPALVVAFAASLLLCLVLGHKGQSTTAFYILPTRGWELLAGALLATRSPAKPSLVSTLLSIIGFLLIAASYWCFSTEKTFRLGGTGVEILLPFFGSLGFAPFPGWVTLPAVAGSLLLLRYGSHGLSTKLLCSPLLVGIGKISYSLYLWHWPAIVFVRYFNYEQQSFAASILILALSFGGAYFSWRFIEMPVRLRPGFTPRLAFSVTALASVFLAAVCAFLVGSKGLRHTLHQRANAYVGPPRPFTANLDKFVRRPAFQPKPYPAIDPEYIHPLGLRGKAPAFCLVGDSHAEALAPGLDIVAAAHQQSGIYIALRMHPYVERTEHNQEQILLRWVADHPDVRDVYLVGRWLQEYRIRDGLPGLREKGTIRPVIVDDVIARKIEDNFRDTARWFEQKGKRVWIFTCVPEYDYSPADIMARSQIIRFDYPIDITAQDYFNRQAPVSRILDRLAKEGLIAVAPLHSALVSGDHTVFMGPAGEPYYSDGDHLTPEGARMATEAIASRLWRN